MKPILKTPEDWPDFIRRMNHFITLHAAPAMPPLVPELNLYLASEITPLWRATEKLFEEENIKPPFWSFAWPGGQALARHILDNPQLVAGKRVFDFATGSGLVALAAKKAGAASVVANDIDPVALVATAMNAEANNLVIETLHANRIDQDMAAFDVILAGDFCYEWPMAGYAIEWLRREVGKGIDVIFADPGRPHAPKSGATELARYTVPTTREVEDSERKETVIYRLKMDELEG